MESEIVTLSVGGILLRLGIALLLVLANGFFVAAEFALVGARRTRIDALADEGNRRAQLARNAIRHLDHYISGTQLGITLASLALGWVGESTIAAILIQLFGGLGEPWNAIASHGIAVAVSFALITFLHIVLGELAPKSLALLFPEQVSMWTSGPLIVFSRVLTPFIVFLNGSANLLLRTVGLSAPHEAERVHRPEELEMLITQSYEHGLLSEEPVDMIRGVFDLSETSAEAVMTPRTRIVALSITATIEEAADAILESGHSRIPVYEGSIDQIVGVLLAREVWRVIRDSPGALSDFVRPISFVPESKSVEALLRQMLAERVHIVVVLDEYGGTAGIVTIEDLLEEIVGEIADEHEPPRPEVQETASGEMLLSGAVPVAEVNEMYGLDLPEEEFTTVAGYVMGRLGRIATPGESVSFEQGRFRVAAMTGRRIEQVGLTLWKDGRNGE